MAGIKAAQTLHEAGMNDFLVLEASDRIGGRICQTSFCGLLHLHHFKRGLRLSEIDMQRGRTGSRAGLNFWVKGKTALIPAETNQIESRSINKN